MNNLDKFKSDFAAILAEMTPQQIREELESFGAEFIDNKNMTKEEEIEEIRRGEIRQAFSSSRVSIYWNNELILGASFEGREKPKNSEEIRGLLVDLVTIGTETDEVDLDIFPSGKTKFE